MEVLSILLVEDDPFLHRIQSQLLVKFGFEVHCVSSGHEAIEWLSQHSVDLVLMDLNMPTMDGLETCQALLKRGFNSPIVALTGNDSEEDRQAAADAGMQGYLTKPIRKPALDALVMELFG